MLSQIITNFYTLTKVEGETKVEILSHAGRLTAEGYYHVVGEVKNNENTSIKDVTIELALFDSDGKLIQTCEQNTDPRVLLTGRKASFSFFITNKTEVSLIKTYELKLVNYREFPEGNREELEILWHSTSNTSIYGKIVFTGFGEASFIVVYAMFYDKNRKIADVSMSQVIYSLHHMEDYPFEIFFSSKDLLERATYYSLTAESKEFAIKNETGLTLLTVLDGNHGYDIFYVFGILVGTSAIGLLVVLLIAKRKQKKRSRRKRKPKTS